MCEKETLSRRSSDPEIIQEAHNSVTVWIFGVTVPHLKVTYREHHDMNKEYNNNYNVSAINYDLMDLYGIKSG